MNSEFSEEEVARYWDQNADSWADQVRKGWDIYREQYNNPAFLPFIGNIDGKIVLDAGCGEGYNTRLLAMMGAKVTGVDISPKMIELAQQEEETKPLGICYEQASFSDLSVFEDASFDVVVSFMALMDSPDFECAIKEIFRVLRSKGELIFSVTHPCFMTRGYGWIQGEDDSSIKLTVSDYFDNRPWVEHWRFSEVPNPDDATPFAVPTFPKTLSEYLNVLIRTGFALKEVEEPRPSEEACRQRPWLQKWRDHAANFLYIRAVKP